MTNPIKGDATMGQLPELVGKVVRAGRLWNQFSDGTLLPVVSGGDGPLGTLEKDIVDLRGEIARVEDEATTKRTAADAKRDELRERGVNPFVDDDSFTEIDGMYREADDAADQGRVLRTRLERALEEAARENGGHLPGSLDEDVAGRRRAARKRISQTFLESDVYKKLQSSGTLRTSNRFSTDPVQLMSPEETIDGLRQRTTVDLTTGGATVAPDLQLWPPIVKPVRQIRLLDLISMTTTESDVVQWVKQTVRGDVAAGTPYGTAAPEADYEFSLQTANVKRIPQFVPATKGILADRGQMQGLLEDQLMYGVRLRAEAQVLAGGGTGEDFAGIMGTAGIGVVNVRDAGHTTEYDLDAIHRAITAIRLALFADPSAIGIHPTDYENVILQKDQQGRYVYPVGQEITTIWGLTPVITPLFTLGTGLVGDYQLGARMWVRDGVSVSASTEHADFYTRGLVAVLAEMRAAFAVVQPAAFAKVVGL